MHKNMITMIVISAIIFYLPMVSKTAAVLTILQMVLVRVIMMVLIVISTAQARLLLIFI